MIRTKVRGTGARTQALGATGHACTACAHAFVHTRTCSRTHARTHGTRARAAPAGRGGHGQRGGGCAALPRRAGRHPRAAVHGRGRAVRVRQGDQGAGWVGGRRGTHERDGVAGAAGARMEVGATVGARAGGAHPLGQPRSGCLHSPQACTPAAVQQRRLRPIPHAAPAPCVPPHHHAPAVELVKQTKALGRLPVVNFAAGGVSTPADAGAAEHLLTLLPTSLCACMLAPRAGWLLAACSACLLAHAGCRLPACAACSADDAAGRGRRVRGQRHLQKRRPSQARARHRAGARLRMRVHTRVAAACGACVLPALACVHACLTPLRSRPARPSVQPSSPSPPSHYRHHHHQTMTTTHRGRRPSRTTTTPRSWRRSARAWGRRWWASTCARRASTRMQGAPSDARVAGAGGGGRAALPGDGTWGVVK